MAPTLFGNSKTSTSVFDSSKMQPRYAMNFSVRLETASRIRDTTYANSRRISDRQSLSVHYNEDFRSKQKYSKLTTKRKRLVYIIGFLVAVQIFAALFYTVSRGSQHTIHKEGQIIDFGTSSRIIRDTQAVAIRGDDIVPQGSILRKLNAIRNNTNKP